MVTQLWLNRTTKNHTQHIFESVHDGIKVTTFTKLIIEVHERKKTRKNDFKFLENEHDKEKKTYG